MPPAPSSVPISYGPRRDPGRRGIYWRRLYPDPRTARRTARAIYLELRTKVLPSTSLNAAAVPQSSRFGSMTNSTPLLFNSRAVASTTAVPEYELIRHWVRRRAKRHLPRSKFNVRSASPVTNRGSRGTIHYSLLTNHWPARLNGIFED